MDDFNPYTQTFILLASDGVTEIPVAVPDADAIYQENLGTCINYGAQIGASFMMLLVLLTMTPTNKLLKATTSVHIIALAISTIRMTLLSIYFTSNWTEFYAWWSGDYSLITAADFQRSVVTEIFSLILFIIVQVSLGLQAWAMVNLLPDFWKWGCTALSFMVSLTAVAFRFTFAVIQIKAILTISWPDPISVAYQSTIIGAVSICYYCALFNVKIVMHLVKNRSVLPSRRGLSAMEVLVVTNGILMIIPAIFAGLEWGVWTNFESGSLTYTSVIIFLPLGTLIAQRLASPTTFNNSRDATYTGHSGTRLKKDLSNGGSRTDSTTLASTVVSKIESGRSKDRVDPIDLELQRIDSDDIEKAGVRVNREFERCEERV